MNAIRVAYDGKIDMFCRIGYLTRVEPEPEKDAPATPGTAKRELTMELFDALWC